MSISRVEPQSDGAIAAAGFLKIWTLSPMVAGARIGMAQNIGGSGATILTHILKAE